MNKFIVGVCTLVELGCVMVLAGIGIKRNNDCYKAEIKLCEATTKLLSSELQCYVKDLEIEELKQQLENVQEEES